MGPSRDLEWGGDGGWNPGHPDPVLRSVPAVRRGAQSDWPKHHLLDLPFRRWVRQVDLELLQELLAHEHEPVPGARRHGQLELLSVAH